jgi:hypothetical protein
MAQGEVFFKQAGYRQVPRRAVLGSATMAALTPALLGDAAAAAGLGAAAPGASGSTPVAPTSPFALPVLTDALDLDQPQYYETLQGGRRILPRTRQNADLDGDGSDELLLRTPSGILAWRYAPEWGQWLDLIGAGPAWSDSAGWAAAEYYTTIQTADVDGDGRAELLGRGPAGLAVYRYDPDAADDEPHWIRLDIPTTPLLDDKLWTQPRYYSTMQCADIDGDGRDELLVRGPDGLHAWRLESTTSGFQWTALATNTGLSDTAGWDHPEYYETLQCARLLGGTRSLVMARGYGGLVTWAYDAATDAWAGAAPTLTDVSNPNDWNVATQYTTLQCADIDGDGRDELLGLDGSGMRAWRLTASGWSRLATLTALKTASGWYEPPYGSTLQCADVDGDGRAELVGRGAAGVRTWKFTGAQGTGPGGWENGPDGPGWDDAAGWNQVQYYSTIQPVAVADGGAVLLGRTKNGIDTWRLDSGTWERSSAGYPAIAASTLSYISGQLYSDPTDPNGPRGQYNNTDRTWTDYITPLQSMVPAPGVGTSDWQAVVAQLTNEFRWVEQVKSWYANLLAIIQESDGLNSLNLTTIANKLQLSTKTQDTTSFILDIISLVTDTVASVLGFNDILKAAEKVVSGVESAAATLSAVTLTAAEGLDYANAGGSTFKGTLTSLDASLGSLWDGAVTAATERPGLITGGNGGTTGYDSGDYGVLAAMGSQILVGNVPQWTWTGETKNAARLGAEQGFAVHAWQMFETEAKWAYSVYLHPAFFHGFKSDDLATVDTYWTNGYYWWPIRKTEGIPEANCYQYFPMQTYKSGAITKSRLLDTGLLHDLMGPRSTTQTFPLGVSAEDVMRAKKGWSKLGLTSTGHQLFYNVVYGEDACGRKDEFPRPWDVRVASSVPLQPTTTATLDATPTVTPAPSGPGKSTTKGQAGGTDRYSPPPPTRKGVDLDVLPILLPRPGGGLDLRLEVTNRGASPATNVVVDDVHLGGVRPDHGVPSRPLRVDIGETVVHYVTLDSAPGRSGRRVTLHVGLTHATGSERENLEVELP